MEITDDFLNACDKCLDLAIEGLERLFDVDFDVLNLSVVMGIYDKSLNFKGYNRYNIFDEFKGKTPPFALVEPDYADALAISLTSISFFDLITESRDDDSDLFGLDIECLEDKFLKQEHQQYYDYGVYYTSLQEAFCLSPGQDDFVIEECFDEELIYIIASFNINAIKKYREARKCLA